MTTARVQWFGRMAGSLTACLALQATSAWAEDPWDDTMAVLRTGVSVGPVVAMRPGPLEEALRAAGHRAPYRTTLGLNFRGSAEIEMVHVAMEWGGRVPLQQGPAPSVARLSFEGGVRIHFGRLGVVPVIAGGFARTAVCATGDLSLIDDIPTPRFRDVLAQGAEEVCLHSDAGLFRFGVDFDTYFFGGIAGGEPGHTLWVALRPGYELSFPHHEWWASLDSATMTGPRPPLSALTIYLEIAWGIGLTP